MTLKLNGSSSGSVSIDAPASTTGGADVTLTLPVNDGDADQYLKTNGSGVLSWAAAGGGKILQIVTASSTSVDQSPSANDTWTDVAPTATITPSSTDSKILIVSSSGCIGKQLYSAAIRVLRGSTSIKEWWTYTSDASEYNPIGITYMYIDSPSTTSATTYKFQIYADNNYDKMYFNYGGSGSSSLNTSEVYLMELGV